ncbi:hypothetical protein VTJ49DRAFT_6396 [Mycothermus thermophilus]|uniref:Heterokaryon incompatibility domain-containing protein n=1 Tax=Humicola insolens TaxID=85995 RepID=A0ABR3VQS5_HUMIN
MAMYNETETTSHNTESIYHPLDASRREIRVLWLHEPTIRTSKAYKFLPKPETSPADWLAPPSRPEIDDEDDPIYAGLTTVSLLDKPAYSALSYTWGSPEDKHYCIFLNGQRFQVRSNLYKILRHLRWLGIGTKKTQAEPRDSVDKMQRMPLWIDAVCINQDDVLERNSQVLLMGNLYRDAPAVVSWLNNLMPEALVRGLGRVHSFAKFWTLVRNFWEEAKEKARRERDPTEQDDSRNPGPGVLGKIETLWKRHSWWIHDLQAVFDGPYWERVWIVQEVVLASPASHVYMSGCRDLTETVTEEELDVLTDCLLSVLGHGDFTNIPRLDLPFLDIPELSKKALQWSRNGVLDQIFMCRDLSKIQRGLVTPGWMFVLHIASTRESSEPRDAVYGLLHLITPSPAEQDPIVPDYQRPVRDVYMDWALRAIRERKDLEILAYAGTGLAAYQRLVCRPKTDLNLPSWVPDLYSRKGPRKVDWTRRQPGEGNENDKSLFTINLTPQDFLITPARRRAVLKSITPVAYDKSRTIPGGYEELMDFVSNYLRIQQGSMYPVGKMPPLQGLIRLVLRPFFASLSPAEANPATGKSVHRLTCGFIWWFISAIRELMKPEDQVQPVFFRPPLPVLHEAHEDVDEGEVLERAASILGLSFGDDFASSYRAAIFPEADVEALMGWKQLEDSAHDPMVVENADMIRVFMFTWYDGCPLLVTEDGYVGRGPRNAEPGDLVYEVKDCSSLLLFRKGGAAVDEMGREPVTLLGACKFVGIGDEFDEQRKGAYNEELLIC